MSVMKRCPIAPWPTGFVNNPAVNKRQDLPVLQDALSRARKEQERTRACLTSGQPVEDRAAPTSPVAARRDQRSP